MPQIGPVTAVSFVATLDDAGRFRGAHQVEAYVGLVPREWSSGETQRRGRITKAGNARIRWLLVEAAWRVATNKKRPETEALRNWADRIARRRGKRVAMVALARKLSGILYAMWRDGSANTSHFDRKTLAYFLLASAIPLPLPATQKKYPRGGWEGERDGGIDSTQVESVLIVRHI